MQNIAQQIYKVEKNIILIYAFNATGKTRLSVAYKDLTKKRNGGKQAGMYYNAYSEDLFVWDNDEENYNQNIKLNIVKSRLNRYHTYLNEELILEKLAPYKPKYKFFLNLLDAEKPQAGFGSVSFYLEEDAKYTTPIKISRGEERIFIWCFFLALFEVKSWLDKQNQHFFIDDPVSSLDDNNIFITAYQLLELLKKFCNTRKIIITTHHMGLFSILQDWLEKGENSNSFKSPKWTKETIQENGQKVIVRKKQYVDKYLICFLEFKDGKNKLVGRRSAIHLYHLLLLKILQEAKDKNKLNTYHFVLLRQVLECTSSFLGSGRFSYVLDKLYPEETAEMINFKADVINALSHDKIYTQKIALLNDNNKTLLSTTLQRLIDNFHFSL